MSAASIFGDRQQPGKNPDCAAFLVGALRMRMVCSTRSPWEFSRLPRILTALVLVSRPPSCPSQAQPKTLTLWPQLARGPAPQSFCCSTAGARGIRRACAARPSIPSRCSPACALAPPVRSAGSAFSGSHQSPHEVRPLLRRDRGYRVRAVCVSGAHRGRFWS